MTDAAPAAPSWGLGDAAAGFIVGVLASGIASIIVLGATGHTDDPDNLELGWVAVLQIPLWIGLLGAPVWATMRKGNGLVADLGLRMRGRDIPLGLLIGVASQYLVVLLYLPIFWLTNLDSEELSAPAREITDKAHSGIGVALLILIVGVGAPVVEEIFYRGLVQRALLRRTSRVVAVLVTAFVFGASHLQPVQFPALALFGIVLGELAYRTGRLGLAIWAHVGFNMISVITLVTLD